MPYYGTKRRVFISHYRGDRGEVDQFIDYFANREGVFTPYVLGANDNDDFINSSNPDYVMQQVRAKYLRDSTVTIVLMGRCTHSRRYVDWEIKSSVAQGQTLPNGLSGIILPSRGANAYLPDRFEANWQSGHANCYARYWQYPSTSQILGNWIEDAYSSRTTRANLINNSQNMMSYNQKCRVCGITH